MGTIGVTPTGNQKNLLIEERYHSQNIESTWTPIVTPIGNLSVLLGILVLKY